VFPRRDGRRFCSWLWRRIASRSVPGIGKESPALGPLIMYYSLMQYHFGGGWNDLPLSPLECDLSLILHNRPISRCDTKNAGNLKFVKTIFILV